MFPKISLAAAFFLIVAPPMACASNRDGANRAPITRQAHQSPDGMVVAQDDQSNAGDSDNDSDSNESADENQNTDGNQTEQQNAAGADQPNPPQVFEAPENPGDVQQAPRPMNPFSTATPSDQ
jgi:hypothetical protein